MIRNPLVKEKIDFNILKQAPLMIVISGPSGVGKDSVLRALKKSSLPIYHVVTPTRAHRARMKGKGLIIFLLPAMHLKK